MSRWFPIESNPDVMNKYFTSLGLTEPAVEMTDVYGVSNELLAMVPQPVFAVAFVYPITDATESFLKAKTDSQTCEVEAFRKTTPFFYTKQYVANACGTIALLHALLNNYDRLGKIADGSVLDKSHTQFQSVQSAAQFGELLATDESLAAAHAEAAQDGATTNQDIDANINLHFVTFIRAGDRCVELDGRQANPILHGHCPTQADLLPAAAKVIEERISLVPNSFEFGITAMVDKTS